MSRSNARRDYRVGQGIKGFFRILIVNADAAFDRHRNRHRRLHGGNAIADPLRLRHQAGAEAAVLHAVGRAADIEIDLVIAEVGANPRRGRQRLRLAAAELQRDRVLRRIERQEPRPITMQHRAGGEHFGIEQRPPRQQPMEIAAVTVGPIHHRGDGKCSR